MITRGCRFDEDGPDPDDDDPDDSDEFDPLVDANGALVVRFARSTA